MTRNRIVLLGVVALAVTAIAVALTSTGNQGGGEKSAANPSTECPEADRVFLERGLPAPDNYVPSCPDPQELQADIESAVASESEAEMGDAVRDALESGLIKEGQNPCTYPPHLRKVIELTDKQCDGRLGRIAAREFD